KKYKKGKHWEAHPIDYAERFADFLLKNNFQGLLADIGCASGKHTAVFRAKGINVVGIDISEDEIETAKVEHPDCRFAKQDAESLEFTDESVAAFFMINVIHYLDKEKAFKEVYRTLKKGGYLFIHFNLLITDREGNIDYSQTESDVMRLVSDFRMVGKKIFERVDAAPKEHTHKILELILQKE
ncbi:class I SAM-dependent methyltransferase, partial [Patescibacteria group bacterium]|nr:class I SAM-dependent methyltransferase [Patescibacteria group bacterium]